MREEKREKLATLVNSCVLELEKYFAAPNSSMGVAQRLCFETLQQGTGQLLDPNKLAVFRSSQAFSEFVGFVMADPELLRAILGQDSGQDFDLRDPSDRRIFQRVAEAYLFRGLVAIHLSSNRLERLADFIDFLGVDEVEREVVVPLRGLVRGLDLDKLSYDLGDFGVLRVEGKMSNDGEDRELFSGDRCLLRFKVKTRKYFGAGEFPLIDLVRNKVAAIRMGANPFVSFNHFGVSHVPPWEEPLSDETFSDRFYGHSGRVIIRSWENVSIVNQSSVEQVQKLYDICSREKWKVISPWRLAVNRLDDAIFKIESGSSDALLDIVIGLESVLVEAESAQESTHKVAVRAARFLENSNRARADLFRAVKRLYSLRSKIAHGKSLGIDDEAKELLKDGVRLLTKVLKKMLEADLTELDLAGLDLS
jgi:hypothetical protein